MMRTFARAARGPFMPSFDLIEPQSDFFSPAVCTRSALGNNAPGRAGTQGDRAPGRNKRWDGTAGGRTGPPMDNSIRGGWTLAGFTHTTVNAVRQTMRRRRAGKDAAKPVVEPRSKHLVDAVRAAGRRS